MHSVLSPRRLCALALAAAVLLVPGGVVTAAQADPAASTALPPDCPAALHDAYTAFGPDGQTYATWHPATVTDPVTGKTCTFGHEHGNDPRSSGIYDWTVDKLGGGATGIPFGFTGAASMAGAEAGGTVVHRHEDHYGHKIIVRNNVRLVRADGAGYVKDAGGKTVTCDYLISAHQGSHSADALRNNAHELMYAMRCRDGAEMLTSLLTLYGSANQYTAACDGRTVTTSGSDLPASSTGARRIPDHTCVEKNVQNGPKDSSDVWGLYELWEADATITAADGHALVRIDPWFGVRNPSRIGDGSSLVPTASLYDATTTTGWPWSGMTAPLDQKDLASPFDGAQRDVYLQHSTIDNAGGASVYYTDAYGKAVSSDPFPGSIRQYLSATRNTDQPEPQRRAFGLIDDFGPDGSGVRAPN